MTGATLELSFCEICGDVGGASAMIVCENQMLGCVGGVHLYCCSPARKEPPSNVWFCTPCAAAAKRMAQEQQRVEEDALVSDSAAETKRRRVAPPPPAPPAPAARDLVAEAFEQLAATTAAMLEAADHTVSHAEQQLHQRYLAQQAAASMAQRSEYQLARCRAGGAVWSGTLRITLEEAQLALACVAFPAPAQNTLGTEAAGSLPEHLDGARLAPYSELEVTEAQLFKESSLVFASADTTTIGAANWGALKQLLEAEKALLRVDLHRSDGMYALLMPNSADPEAALCCVMAMPLIKAERVHGASVRGILRHPAALRAVPGARLRWADGAESSHAGPAAAGVPSTGTREPTAVDGGAAAAVEYGPLHGLRIVTLAIKLTADIPYVAELQQMGAQFFFKGAYPGCCEIIVIHARALGDGMERCTSAAELAACLVAPSALERGPVHVFEGINVLEEMRTKRRLLTTEELRAPELKPLFTSGLLLISDVGTLQQLDPVTLKRLLEGLESGRRTVPGGMWRMALHPGDLQAWEQVGSGGWAPETIGAANLRAWRTSSVTGTLQPAEISNSDGTEPSLFRHAVKAAHNLRGACRSVFVMSIDEMLLQTPAASVLLGRPAEALQVLQQLLQWP